jgi:ribonuclease BN (tRNA processing enzyme)
MGSAGDSDRSGVGRVIFLGTGDPLNEERAQTCLAVPAAAGETMLIDVSGGIDVLRRLTAAGFPLDSVHHLLISHRHFDHAGGLAPLLVALTPLPGASLTVYALPETLRALREMLALNIPGIEDWMGERLRWEKLMPGRQARVGKYEVMPFEVDHGIECAGFRITQGGSILVYAADTRPCEIVVEYAQNADLLIHESYSLEDGAEQAHTFGHSTAAEAGRVAREAGAKRLILTHVRASRYVDPAELAAEAKVAFGGPVEAARDLDSFDFQGWRRG